MNTIRILGIATASAVIGYFTAAALIYTLTNLLIVGS